MEKSNPYHIIKSRYITEKGRLLERLKEANSNRSLMRCKVSKYLFLVDKSATKPEIRRAVEHIYADDHVKVLRVNTIYIKPKPRRVRGRKGMKAGFKKAIVTFQVGDTIKDGA